MLKLIINKEALNEAISHVARAVSSRATIPILSGIKIDASHQGVVFTASDTDISIQSHVPLEQNNQIIVKLEEPGSVVLPAKFLVDLIKKLPSKDIEIETTSGFQTMIRSGSSEVNIVGLDPDEYPLLPQLSEERKISLPSDLLKTMIKQTVFAVSANETTPILTGILWNFTEQNLNFVATDRHRLASREGQLQQPLSMPPQNVVISGKTMNELYKLLPDEPIQVDLIVTDSQVLIKMDSILFFSRILDGTYPETSKIIPQSYKTEMTLNTKQLMDAIDRAYLLSREEKTNIVRLVTKDNEIEISSSSNELGRITEKLYAESMNGEELKISFNSKYMLDALKVIDSEHILIGFTGAMSPIIIKPQDATKMLHLILPYRTVN